MNEVFRILLILVGFCAALYAAVVPHQASRVGPASYAAANPAQTRSAPPAPPPAEEFGSRITWVVPDEHGRIFKPGLLVAVGEVVDFSPNLARPAKPKPPMSAQGGSDEGWPDEPIWWCWVRLRLVERIAGSADADTVTLHFQQSRPNAFTHGALATIRFAKGDLLAFLAVREPYGYAPVLDVCLVNSCDSPVVQALKEYARWDALPASQRVDELIQAVMRPRVQMTRMKAITVLGALGQHAQSSAERARAFRVLEAVACNKEESPYDRMEAAYAARRFYKIKERGGISSDVLNLMERVLSDRSLPLDVRRNLVQIINGLGYKEPNIEPDSPASAFRPRVLAIVDRLISKEKDPSVLRLLKESRDWVRAKGRSASVIVAD